MGFRAIRFKYLLMCLIAPCLMLHLASAAAAATFSFSVQGDISGPLAGVNVYAFTESGSYTGVHAATDLNGHALFTKEDLPDSDYRFRVDYLGGQFWSDPVTFPLADTAGFIIAEADLVFMVADSFNPLPSVNTYLFSESGAYLGLSSTTDAAGRAAYTLPADMSVKCRADYMGYQFWSAAVAASSGPQIDLTIPSQNLNITVQGVFQGATQPLEGIPAYLFKPPSSYMGAVLTTDADGRATFNLPDQVYKVRANYLGGQFWSNDFSASNTTIDIPLADAAISVTGNGAALSGIKVYVFSGAGAYLGVSGTTDAAGQVTFRLPAGEYKFRADYQNSQYWSVTGDLQADAVNPLGISTGGGTFALNVKKAPGLPMAGTNCYAFTASDSYLGLAAATDTSGQAHFALADGSCKFRIDHLGYQYWTDTVTIPDTLSITFTLPHQDATVTVTADYQGTLSSLADIPVYLFKPDGPYLGMNSTTNGAGEATFNLPANTYAVRADYLGQQFWSDPFNGQTVQIEIPTGMASVHVTSAGQDLAGVPVYIFTSSGAYLGIHDATDGTGTVSFTLPAGSYRMRADYQGSQYWADAAVTADTVSLVNLSTGGGTFNLTINDGATALTDTPVYVFNTAGSYLGLSGTTDADGTITFDLAEGGYRFRVDLLGAQFWSADYNVPDILTGTFTIAHQDLTATVQNDYPSIQGLANVPTYLFSAAGAYLGCSANTDADGRVVYRLPDQGYKIRADYLGNQFWSEVFQSQDTILTISHGMAEIHVARAGSDLAGALVYLFSATDTYLGWSQTTDAAGRVSFLLPTASYKFRIDETGRQHWSPLTAVPAGQAIEVPIVIDPLAVMLSATPTLIAPGQDATLTWTSENAETCTIEPDIGFVDLQGSIQVSPTETITYTITAARDTATVSESVTVTVNAPPEFTLIEPDGTADTADQAFTITWNDADPDDDAQISLFYDTDAVGADGTLIVQAVSEDDTGDSHVWDTASLPDGDYFVYAVIEDGVNPPLIQYSQGPVTISHEPVPTNVTAAVAGSGMFTIALRSDASVWMWGNYIPNGAGGFYQSITPVRIQGIPNAIALADGTYPTRVVAADRSLWVWGTNNYGQLGLGTTINNWIPTQVPGVTDVQQVSTSNMHTVIRKTDRTLMATGFNYNGQLGDGSTVNRNQFVPVQGMSNIVDIACGNTHTVALRADGTVWTWGRGYEGELGNGTNTMTQPSPVQAANLYSVVNVASGRHFSAALKSDGTVWTWGENGSYQLGDGTTIDHNTPVQVPGIPTMVAIACGADNMFALTANGIIWAWGNNAEGQTGLGTSTNLITTPTATTEITNVSRIFAGADSGYAIQYNGMLHAWGDNGLGQIGDGTTNIRFSPVQTVGENGEGFFQLITGSSPPPTATLTATPAQINQSESTTLTWSTTDADTVTISEIGSVAPNGEHTVAPSQTSTYILTALGSGGVVTATATVDVISPITITITHPAASHVDRPDILVAGTVTHANGLETRVLVNDIPAMVSDGRFALNHLPLAEGDNTITITALDDQGNFAQEELTIAANTGEDYVSLEVSPESCLSPAEVNLRTGGTVTPQSSTLADTGPGAVTYQSATANTWDASMTATGFYFFTLEAVAANNQMYTDTVAVQVLDEAAMDQSFKAKWNRLRAAMAAGDAQGALNEISTRSRASYAYHFNLLPQHLPVAAEELSDIRMVYIRETFAEYEMISVYQGQTYSYPVKFIRDTDGVWRIWGF